MYEGKFGRRNLMKTLLMRSPGSSWLHSLNPIVKGFGALTCIGLLTFHDGKCFNSGLIVTAIFLAGASCGLSMRRATASLCGLWFLFFAVIGFHIFGEGETGFFTGLESIIRIAGIVYVSTIFVGITSKNEFLYFWEKVLTPLKIIGGSLKKCALVMAIGVRYFP